MWRKVASALCVQFIDIFKKSLYVSDIERWSSSSNTVGLFVQMYLFDLSVCWVVSSLHPARAPVLEVDAEQDSFSIYLCARVYSALLLLVLLLPPPLLLLPLLLPPPPPTRPQLLLLPPHYYYCYHNYYYYYHYITTTTITTSLLLLLQPLSLLLPPKLLPQPPHYYY